MNYLLMKKPLMYLMKSEEHLDNLSQGIEWAQEIITIILNLCKKKFLDNKVWTWTNIILNTLFDVVYNKICIE